MTTLINMSLEKKIMQDLKEAIHPGSNLEQIVDEHYNPLIKLIRLIEKPIIASIMYAFTAISPRTPASRVAL